MDLDVIACGPALVSLRSPFRIRAAEARHVRRLLELRFFEQDKYPDRRSKLLERAFPTLSGSPTSFLHGGEMAEALAHVRAMTKRRA